MERGAPSLTRWGTGGQKIKQGFEFLRQQNLAPPQGATKPLLFFAPAFPVGAAFKLEYLILNPVAARIDFRRSDDNFLPGGGTPTKATGSPVRTCVSQGAQANDARSK
jgi:hypothetical protein